MTIPKIGNTIFQEAENEIRKENADKAKAKIKEKLIAIKNAEKLLNSLKHEYELLKKEIENELV